MKLIKSIFNLFRSKDRVSNAWLYDQATKECAEGWEGPRWRFPAEIIDAQIRTEKERRAQ